MLRISDFDSYGFDRCRKIGRMTRSLAQYNSLFSAQTSRGNLAVEVEAVRCAMLAVELGELGNCILGRVDRTNILMAKVSSALTQRPTVLG